MIQKMLSKMYIDGALMSKSCNIASNVIGHLQAFINSVIEF